MDIPNEVGHSINGFNEGAIIWGQGSWLGAYEEVGCNGLEA